MTRTIRRARRPALLAVGSVLTAVLTPAAVLTVTSARAAHAASALSRNVTANLFEYDWNSVAQDCTNVLGPDGFAAVQVSPPQDSYDNVDHYWWDVYQPVDYSIDGRLGTASQFSSMVAACHAAGVKVYADVVLNHMATGDGGSDTSYGGASFDSATLTYPAYTSADFHSYPADCPESSDSIVNWLSYTEVTQCRVDGLPDLATNTTAVRDTEAAYLNNLIGLGIDGFRLDSATEIGETDIAAIEALLTDDSTTGTPVFITQEVYPGSSGQDSRLNPTSFEPEGSVTSFDYSYDVTDDFENGDLAALDTIAPALPSADASSFITNQDTERASSPTLSYKNGSEYILADEFLLAYGYGTPQIFSSFEFSSYNQAPPDASNGDVTATVCGTGTWECTEQNTAIDALVGWHDLAYTNNDTVANWTSDGNDLVAFSRGSDAWIALNNGTSAQTATFTTGLPNGTYCDIVNDTYSNGACSGTGITVANGSATVTVPAGGSVAFDTASAITSASASASPSASPSPTTTYTETLDVTVPVNTAAAGLNVYLNGNLSALGEGGANWTAGDGIEMTKVDDTHYTATLTATSEAALAYKYYLGTSLGDIEESRTCAATSNRALTVANGTVTDTVVNWAGPNTCGNAEAVIDVTVPSSTPSTDTVYIAGTFSALGTGMSSANDWSPGLYPMTLIGTDEWQAIVPAVSGTTLSYKLDLNGTWSNVEETSTCGSVANRSFYFNGADSSYTASDTVGAWEGLGSC
ncbi:alpha amylase C-terminal domain-containing protein [Actinospica durhamensis]|uniref:Alpha-amylase n=1 Tax=Actinospica durhamensis TaxID=1508375 RepID=A0A941IQF3_9ACTN|nr:alpha-amylase family glycosyl hydrolase [Actinospica durhamensis]MBR7836159.1 alpha amylase C-terminal domain-containing protein [Actinospica durhamensis]